MPESHHHRKQAWLPNPTGVVALGLAIVGFVLAILVGLDSVGWYVPLFFIAPAVSTAVSALNLRYRRKFAAIVALIICAFAAIPPTAAIALTGLQTELIPALAPGAEPQNPVDSFVHIFTGQGGQGGDAGTFSEGDGDGNTDGDGDTTTDPTTPIIDVDVDGTGDGGGITVDTPVAVLSGGLGDLLTTASGVGVTVNSAECGLPVVSLLGLPSLLGGQLCAVNVSVNNGSDHLVTVNNASLLASSGGSSILGDLTLGHNALSANVAAGGSTSGTLYVRLPSSSSTLDALQLQLGGEPSSSLLTVTTN